MILEGWDKRREKGLFYARRFLCGDCLLASYCQKNPFDICGNI